jgi:hypothetical protein
VERDVSRLDLQRSETELGSGWVTTIEQTMLALAARPTLGGIEATDANEATRALAVRVDWPVFEKPRCRSTPARSTQGR